MEDTYRNRVNGYFKFIEDPYIREIAIHLLVSDPLERTFTVGYELINANLVNDIPTSRDIHMKISHMWSTYIKPLNLLILIFCNNYISENKINLIINFI